MTVLATGEDLTRWLLDNFGVAYRRDYRDDRLLTDCVQHFRTLPVATPWLEAKRKALAGQFSRCQGRDFYEGMLAGMGEMYCLLSPTLLLPHFGPLASGNLTAVRTLMSATADLVVAHRK